MAQERPIELLVTPTAPPVAVKTPNSKPATIDSLSSTATPNFMNRNGQHLQGITQVNSGLNASEDDEVQFVFSAPRRRKRKRKRLEFSYSPSMLNQCSVPQKTPPPKRDSTTQWDPLRRRSLGVLEQLESCHIGTRESKDYLFRRSSLPVAPFATTPLPKAQASWFPDARHVSLQAVQPPSQLASVLWWDESRPLAQTIQPTQTAQLPDWWPLHGSASKKRRLDGEVPSAQAQRLSQSSQVSPRTTLVSTLPKTGSSLGDSAMGTSDMLWTPDLPSLPGTQPSNKPLFNSWLDFDWNAFHNVDSALNQQQPVHQNMLTPPKNQGLLTNSPHQPRIGHFEPRNMWQQNISRVPATPQVQRRPAFESAQSSPPFQTRPQQTRPQHLALPNVPMSFHNLSSQPGTILSQNLNTTSTVAPIPIPQHQGLQFQRQQTSPSPRPAQASFQRLQTTPSDLLRKPSLYKIPAWPSTKEASLAQIPIVTSRSQSPPAESYTASSRGFQSGMNFSAARQPSNSMKPNTNPSRNFENRSNAWAVNTFSSTPRVTGAKTDLFEIPRARTSHKHCPNLIVDIAETCQDLFPFAEVAERHSVPIKKVFDTFSAIIQLPLLRNADDRRRNGSLGKQRMREYRDARKAMEKAQETERKARMKELRARVEDAGKRGKGQADPSGLLKTAILNNANQAGSGS